ncbi:hypothetical protein vseg_014780 [Gypsophila vaccaria]
MARLNFSIVATLVMLLISLSTPPTTADYDNAVLDTSGNTLVAGEFYYAVPVTGSSVVGGLTMFNNDAPTCPDFIVSQSNVGPEDLGIPLALFPQDPSQTSVSHGSSDYNIAFKFLSILPECRRLYTTVWTVSVESSSLVVLNGEKGDQTSWFKIKKSNDYDGYTIRYSSTSFGGSMSKDVGVVTNEQGVNLLSIDDGAIPLVVVFVKA